MSNQFILSLLQEGLQFAKSPNNRLCLLLNKKKVETVDGKTLKAMNWYLQLYLKNWVLSFYLIFQEYTRFENEYLQQILQEIIRTIQQQEQARNKRVVEQRDIVEETKWYDVLLN